MYTCENCSTKFESKDVRKSFWFGYKTIYCRGCNTAFEHTFKNRLLGGASVGLGTMVGCVILLNLNYDFQYKFVLGLLANLLVTIVLSSIFMNYFSFKKELK